MRQGSRSTARPGAAYTMLEVMLVIAILGLIAALAAPNLLGEIQRRRLYTSALQMRSLLELVRYNAQFDGKRYRIRFPKENELDPMGGDRQPIIEREDDPLEAPDEWNPVVAPWTYGHTLLEGVWCIQVRLGRPTLESLRNPEESMTVADKLEAAFEDFEPDYPPLYVEPDGTSDWATFALTQADRDLTAEDLDDSVVRIEVIVEGPTGMIWLQRPLYEEELDLFEENGWPPVLRKDFFDPDPLTEDDVLELTEESIQP
ncbi:MAG: prepilin-type N-terminal cleavage/methylation domain-containing protein [Phycisphaerales bacterium]|nr:MAG: prepilin-type N-terminal cleavage/methylation domain-containing protein [Phycisphaerales bacterium]